MIQILDIIMIYAIHLYQKMEQIFVYMIEEKNLKIIIYVQTIANLLNMILIIINLFVIVKLKMEFHLKKN